MSLTKHDLSDIRGITLDAAAYARLDNQAMRLEVDMKKAYSMLVSLRQDGANDEVRICLEEKLFKLNAELLATAKEAGISLPR